MDLTAPNKSKVGLEKLNSDNADVDETRIDEEEETEDFPNNDPFFLHFDQEITDDLITSITEKEKVVTEKSWPVTGNLTFTNYQNSTVELERFKKLENISLAPVLVRNLEKAIIFCQKRKALSEQQLELLSVLSQYKDLLHNERTLVNGEDVRFVYCLHALNHALKTRSRILHHNAKIRKNPNGEYRDQGFTRPKVLILLPYKESALRVVNIFTNLLVPDSKGNVVNKKRFKDEFSSDEPPPTKKLKPKPADHDAMFAGNIDDAFRIGMSLTKRSIRLYADFYAADIIVCSPLGLRTIIGAEGEKNRDFDFLSSVEVLIIDQVDVLLMQNWEHVVHILQHLNLQAKEPHGVDFSRIRMWTLGGHAKCYRQSAIFGSINSPVISSLFNKYCLNYAGNVVLHNPVLAGTIQEVIIQVPQIFHRFEVSKVPEMPDERFKFFVSKILPNFKDSIMQHTMIFIPSYFDYVRIRNYFKREDMSFVQICEYSKDGKVARARDMFFHGQKHFLLYTERAHFYHRYRLKGVRHIIFYDLPVYPHFYSELSNYLHADLQGKVVKEESSNTSCTVLYSKYDGQQLSAVVGLERTRVMLYSEKKVHMFVTEKT